jgi:hypothetical protein
MSAEIAKKRGRPKKVTELDGSFPSGLSSKPSTPKKSTKQPSSSIAASKKSNGSRSKEIPKAVEIPTPQIELKPKAPTIATRAPSKTTSKSKPDSPPPEVLKAIARQESIKILQQIAALKVEEELKKAAGLTTTPPILPTPLDSIQLAKPQPPPETPTIPSSQSSTMPSTSTPSSTYYQWLPNPPILTQQTAFRTLSTTTKLSSQPKTKPYSADATRKAKALNRLVTDASIPKAKEGLNPGGFPVTYKSATRRITAIIVAAPIALCMSWFLYERCELLYLAF